MEPPSAGMKSQVDFEGVCITKNFITGIALKCQQLAMMPFTMALKLLVTLTFPVAERTFNNIWTQTVENPLLIFIPEVSARIPPKRFQKPYLFIMHALHDSNQMIWDELKWSRNGRSRYRGLPSWSWCARDWKLHLRALPWCSIPTQICCLVDVGVLLHSIITWCQSHGVRYQTVSDCGEVALSIYTINMMNLKRHKKWTNWGK